MRHLMLVDVRLLRKLFAARFALERLLAGVDHKVALQIRQLVERFVAGGANERPLAGVDLGMLEQTALRRERLLAVVAAESIAQGGRMADQHVRIQFVLCTEVLHAKCRF